jgi:putative CocE/NonD family hydrolase
MTLERNLLVPLSDGTTLAADLYLPDAPGPHPALISFYPYRKDDVIGSFSAYPQRWFASRGYAHLLVDVRGYGGSEGRHAESFDPRPEAADAGEVVEWAATQEWCDGAVAVWGVSYGGLMALAAGVARPPHLRAIAPVYPLYDEAADVTWPGGVPAMLGQHQWSTLMLAQRLAPPTYRDADGRWERVWQARLEQLRAEELDVRAWQSHPPRDRYWRERVLDLSQVEVPTFLIGGWRDLFPEAVSAAHALIGAPRRLLFGPWLHVPPDVAAREPVDWLQLLDGFFAEHLRGAPPDGTSDVLAFVQGDGGWRGAPAWPPADVGTQTLYPAAGGTLVEAPSGGVDDYAAVASVGTTAGQLDPFGTGMGYPLDQGPDDLRSLSFTGPPLAAPLELAGSAEAVLELERLDRFGPFDLSARLVDVAPDGRSELITSGSARSSGGPTSVRLRATAWRLAAGHRLRLAVACGDFPRTWPDPTSPRLRLHRRSSFLRLPVTPVGLGTPVEPPRPVPVDAAERFPWTLDGAPAYTIEHDLANGAVSVTLGGGETLRLPEGGTLALRQRGTARVAEARPQDASVEASARIEIAFPGGPTVVAESKSSATRTGHAYAGRVTLDGQTLFDRAWSTA